MSDNTNRHRYFEIPLILLLAIVPSGAAAQGSHTLPQMIRFDSSCVWKAPEDFRKSLDSSCGEFAGAAYRRCFLDLLRQSGASPQALLFTELTDTTAYVRHFKRTGTVDVAFLFYPFRANENFGTELVNGDPQLVDVDDFQYLDLRVLKNDSTYLRILSAYPDAAVWPGDRFSLSSVKERRLPEGGQRFVIAYLLLNGCHACERLGEVDFAFDFDSAGIFIGTRLVSVVSFIR